MTPGTACKIGWRNLWRNPRRSLLTLAAVAFAAAVLVFFVALQLSSYETSINATVGFFYGHLQVQRRGYLKKPQIELAVPDAEKLAARIKRLPEVNAAVLRASAFALLSAATRSYGAQVVGVDPQEERQVSNIPGLIKQGRFLDAPESYEAVLGWGLAKNLGVAVGDEVAVLGQGKDGSLAAGSLTVVGVFETGSRDVDRAFAEIPLPVFREIFSLLPGEAHAIVVRAAALNRLDAVKERAAALVSGGGLDVVGWEDLLPGLRQSIELDMASGWLFYLSLVLVVTFTVLNTFLMTVLERMREFGIMLALGVGRRSVALLIMLECLMLTAAGNAVGVIAGAAVVLYFGQTGFSIPGTEEVLKQWNLPSEIFPGLTLRAIAAGPLIIALSAALSVCYPIWKIMRITPIEAMRHV